MATMNPGKSVEELANGAPYPITKEGLIAYARQQHEDERVVDVLNQLPDSTFTTCNEVIQQLARPTSSSSDT